MSQSYSVTKIVPLPVSPVHYFNEVEKENQPISRYETIGGVLLDTKYIWTANGSQFTVINSKTGSKVAAWNFGAVVRDYSTKVVCVDELSRPVGKLPLLVIGLASAVTGGMICIFDITGSRVLRAIQIDEKVTSLHVIDASYDKCPLPGPLRAFDGILSIGTAGGNVLLLDICRHTCDEVSSGSSLGDIRDEINSCSVKTIFLDDIYSLELYKQVAIKNGEHLAIHLNATENDATPHFILKGPKGDDRVHVNKVEVIISALHYCPQLGSLLVGYNFGAWQLWNLIDLQLVYTSPIYEENVPVSQFSVQEPCDDPRAFCYVWVIYSNTEPYHANFPLAVLYSLNYDAKEWHEGYGILYQDLTSCSVRFQTELTLFDEINADNIQQGAYCLRLQSINKSMSKGGTLQELQEETIALCSIVWNGWSSKSNIIHTYMSLFDLNQWYKEQMPNSPRLKQCGTYMTHICLSKLLPTSNAEPSPFLDLRLDLNTLSQFFGSHKLEEHYYPTSLAFNLCGLKKNDVVFFNNPGKQRAFLSHLESTGPLVLLKPAELFQQSIDLGLYPLFVDLTHSLSIDDQRELILSIALEQQLLGWLCRCASVWSNGSYSTAGCTLHFLITWGWQRALVLKQNADKLSTSLFDYSGLKLDANNHKLLSNCARQLKNLSTFFGYIVKRFARFLLHPDVVQEQWESLQMVSVHLEVLQWLLNVGLLPECPISSYPRADEFNRISAPYPVHSLMKYYDERRTHLQSINKEHFSTSGSLLFIDNLIELECGGQKVQKQWEEDNGNGLYPPPSLQALLRTYLIEGVEISFKHCIVVYVFLDLAMTLDQSRYKPIITHLIKFPAVFQLSPSIIKITQAFWQLDHGDFSTAMEQLLDPLVCAEDLKIWHHRIALKALLAQNQHKFALLYLQVRQPAVTEVEDLCTVLSLFIVNNMLDEAFHFQRQNRSAKNEEKLLQHFYRECDRKGEIPAVIHLPLLGTEEKAFMKYLHDVQHPKLQDLQIFYYIQRSQYVDAFELNDKLSLIKHSSKGLKGQENTGFRDVMVKEFTDTLPGISKSLMKLCKEDTSKQWREVTRPEPFSVFVHNPNGQAKYKSTIIHTVLSKAKETWTHPILNVTPKKDYITHPITEEMPFLNTPKAMQSESRIATPLIFPKVTILEENCQDEDGVSPAKRFKPSPRLSMSTEKQRMNIRSINTDITCSSICTQLDTPIVKRKFSKQSPSMRCSDEKFSVGTPQSILKVYNLVRNSRSPDQGKSEDKNITTDVVDIPVAHEVDSSKNKLGARKISLGLTPRKPLPGTPRYGVRFDISRGSSESSLTSEPSFEIVHDEAMIHSSLEGIHKKMSELKPNTSQQSEAHSKNSSLSTDELFYSPDTSSNTESKSTSVLQSNLQIDESKVLNQQVSKDLIGTNSSAESKMVSPRKRSYARHLEESINVEETADVTLKLPISVRTEITPSSPKTPKSRKSYRGDVGIRSSPRLRKSLLQTPNEQDEPKEKSPPPQLNSESSNTQIPPQESPYTPSKGTPSKSKLRGRRPLSRQVLENNTFLKMIETPASLEASSLLSSLEVSYLKTETQNKKTIEITEEYKRTSDLHPDTKLEEKLPEIINSDLKLNDSNSAFDSTNVSCNQLDMAYVADSILEPSSSAETSIRSERNDSVSPQVAGDVHQEEEDKENDKTFGKDQQMVDVPKEDFSSEGEDDEESKSISKKNTENQPKCDSDADTVEIEADLVPDSANIYDDLSSDNNYGSTDPQMNVFEISDDLDLNEDMCVGKNVHISEIDVNYTTSSNDEEVFADKSEVLTDVVAVNEFTSGQFDSSEPFESKKTIENLNNSQQVLKEIKDENEVIELVTSSEEEEDDYTEEDDTDRNSESSFKGSSESSIIEEEFNKEESEEYSEHSSYDQPEEVLVNEQNMILPKETLSESDYSRNSEIISDNNSRESYSNQPYQVEFCEEEQARTEEYGNNEVAENETAIEVSEEILNIGQLDVIPEETSDVLSETNSESKEVASNTLTNLTSIDTEKETDVYNTEIVEDYQLNIIPEEVSETSEIYLHLSTISEELSECDENAITESTKIGHSEGLPNDDNNQTSSTNKDSLSTEQQTVIEVQHAHTLNKTDILDKTQSIEDPDLSEKAPDVKLHKTRAGLNQTDILDTTRYSSDIHQFKPTHDDSSFSQSYLDITSSNHPMATTDILDKTQSIEDPDLSEKSRDVKLHKTRAGLNQTDILDATRYSSDIHQFKPTHDDSSFSQSSLNTTSSNHPMATTDILDKTEYTKSRENLLSQTCLLDHTTAEKTEQNNIANVSQLCDEVFKENLEKTSTPARRSRRLSSLQLSTPSDQILKRRTRRSASFDLPQKTDDISQPSTSKDSFASEIPPAKQLRGRSNSTEVIQAQVSSPRTKRATVNIDNKDMPLRKRILRSSSTDVEVKENETKSPLKTRNRKAASVHDLPVIKEDLKDKKGKKSNEEATKKSGGDVKEDIEDKKSNVSESGRKQTVKQPKKPKSTVTPTTTKTKMQEYSTTRRLTRRQATLLEKALGDTKMNIEDSELHQEHCSDSEDSENDERGPNISKLDPIHLLDKPSFEGKHDSDEEKHIQESPSSSIPESPVGSQSTRRLRSRSSISNTSPRSEVSTVPSLSEAVVSIKRKLVKHPIAGPSTRTKQRSKSVDEKSQDMPSPPKLRRTRRGSKEQDSGSDISSVSKTRSLVETKKSTVVKRTRSASVQHLDEAGQSPLRRSERRSFLAKSDLPQIIEEQNPSAVNAVPKASKRNLRKGSNKK